MAFKLYRRHLVKHNIYVAVLIFTKRKGTQKLNKTTRKWRPKLTISCVIVLLEVKQRF